MLLIIITFLFSLLKLMFGDLDSGVTPLTSLCFLFSFSYRSNLCMCLIYNTFFFFFEIVKNLVNKGVGQVLETQFK
jgi:hypothetical protein